MPCVCRPPCSLASDLCGVGNNIKACMQQALLYIMCADACAPLQVIRGRVLGEGAFGVTYEGKWRGAKVGKAIKHCLSLGAGMM
eukprot:1161915-Pelagomonas_calceolata.AAC.3